MKAKDRRQGGYHPSAPRFRSPYLNRNRDTDDASSIRRGNLKSLRLERSCVCPSFEPWEVRDVFHRLRQFHRCHSITVVMEVGIMGNLELALQLFDMTFRGSQHGMVCSSSAGTGSLTNKIEMCGGITHMERRVVDTWSVCVRNRRLSTIVRINLLWEFETINTKMCGGTTRMD